MAKIDYSGPIASIRTERPGIVRAIQELTQTETERARELKQAQVRWDQAAKALADAKQELSTNDNAVALLEAAQKAADDMALDDDE